MSHQSKFEEMNGFPCTKWSHMIPTPFIHDGHIVLTNSYDHEHKLCAYDLPSNKWIDMKLTLPHKKRCVIAYDKHSNTACLVEECMYLDSSNQWNCGTIDFIDMKTGKIESFKREFHIGPNPMIVFADNCTLSSNINALPPNPEFSWDNCRVHWANEERRKRRNQRLEAPSLGPNINQSLQQNLNNKQHPSKINGIFHIVGGTHSNKHFVWNVEQNKLQHIHSIEYYSPGGICFGRMVHLASQNKILTLGGFDSKFPPNDGSINTILEYSIVDNEWSKLTDNNGMVVTLPIEMHGFGCVLTKQDRYIILFGGCNNRKRIRTELNDIYVLDLKSMKWNKSDVKCPVSGVFIEAILAPLFDDVHIFEANHHWRIRLKTIIPNYGFDLVLGYLRRTNFTMDLIKLVYEWL
eukprot:400204_1